MSTPSRGSSPVDVPEYNTQFEPGPDDNETLWNVLEIIKEDKKRYLVKWEGLDPDTRKPWDPSWVPKCDCTDDLIFEWKLTKAKKDKARKKKKDKSKGEMDAYDPKPLAKSHKAEKAKSKLGSSAPSHKSSSTAEPSRLPPDASNGKSSPVVELIRHKKRRRESHPLDGEVAESVTEVVPQLKKQRKRVANQRDVISHFPASKDNAELSSKLAQLSSRSGSSRDHDRLDATLPKGTSQGHSRSPGGQQRPEIHLAPVRTISPAEFESYVSKAHSVIPDSQISSIETFSPNKGQATTKHGTKSQELKQEDPQLRDGSTNSQRQCQGAGSDNNHNSGLHDPIDDYESPPSDQALELRGAKLVEQTARQQRSLSTLTKPARRPLSDIMSSSISSNPNVVGSERDGEFAMVGNDVVSEAESHQHTQGLKNAVKKLGSQSPTESLTRHSRASSMDNPSSKVEAALHYSDADSMYEEQKELDREETDELGPEDALDGRESPRPPVPSKIFPSAEANYSLEANAALTQQSTFRLPAITSPVRELNHALGLLNRKSEEIELLKVALKNHQSCMAELDGELASLKHNLKVAEERYEEINVALSKERAAKGSQEGREVREESTLQNSTTSPSVKYADSLMELHRENEELKLTKARLESDTDMLRKLYAQASDAHQTRVVEIKALKQDSDSLREQATTGVKQAHLFWTTQVHTLEKELVLSRGTIELLTDQARRTDDDVRKRAALLPMARRETETVKQELEDLKATFMELGKENTQLRLEVKGWEDDAMTRRKKEQEVKEQESAAQDELVWVCPWMDDKHKTKCGALLESREKLHEHLFEAGHL